MGSEYNQKDIEKELSNLGANFEILDEHKIADKTSEKLKDGNVIGWFEEWNLGHELWVEINNWRSNF